MIGRVYRGGRVGGLLRYLYGPGRHNEHVDPHLVGAWDGGDETTLLALEPPEMGGGYDVRPLTAELEAPQTYAVKRSDQPVWHCPLRVADGDRRLTDAEWREVAVDVMHRTGIAPRGDDGACRWVAVRHDDVSVHLVAVLARQDGRPVRLWRDYHRLREACLAAEQRLGLQVTAPIDGTADPAVTRAETEKASRSGRREEPRVRLRREVRLAAVHAGSTGDFFTRVRGFGLLVRERYGEAGDLTGYAVAVPGDVTAAGLPVWYGGGRLAPDLTLPKLEQRWATPRTPALRALEDRELMVAAASLARSGRVAAIDLPATADAFIRIAYLLEGRLGGGLTDAARSYQRSARRSRRTRPLGSSVSRRPTASAAKSPKLESELGAILLAITNLVVAVESWHEREARGQLAAAGVMTERHLRRAFSNEENAAVQIPGRQTPDRLWGARRGR